ncbi:hypothetical protein H0H87_002927 [Tephrocybe sp. NHM501043]|nr:hypothetical protein H0H87_002927 [Tephrocybe sp. NHM501043]
MIEALVDPKTWLFALFSFLDNIPNSLTNQRQIIVSSFGFTALQTTLLGCVDGIVEIITIWSGVTLAATLPNSRAWVAFVYFIPNVLGCFLVNFLPWQNKIGVGTTGFVLSLSWLSNTTSGHTKRVTVNAIMLCAYCIGNAVGPFMWQAQYKPRCADFTLSVPLAHLIQRNHVPWIIIGVCYFACMVLILILRWLLARENMIRDNEPIDTTYDDVYIERTVDGMTEKVKVDKVRELLHSALL